MGSDLFHTVAADGIGSSMTPATHVWINQVQKMDGWMLSQDFSHFSANPRGQTHSFQPTFWADGGHSGVVVAVRQQDV